VTFPDEYMTQPCTITHVDHDGAEDRYGDPTETTTTTEALGWLTQPTRDDDTDRTNQQRELWVGYFPAGTVLDGSDRVTVAGETFEVRGPPSRPFNPLTNSVAYVEATLIRVV
jgi:hypothetical protein